MRAISPICRPTVCTGLSAVSGSWKIMAISLPRTLRTLVLGQREQVAPFHRISPSMTPSVGSSPRMLMAVTDLPEPDSPTTANTSPRSMSKDTPSTAFTRRRRC